MLSIKLDNTEKMTYIDLGKLIPFYTKQLEHKSNNKYLLNGFTIHFLAAIITTIICYGFFQYFPLDFLSISNPYYSQPTSVEINENPIEIKDVGNYIKLINNELGEIHRWRMDINSFITKMHWEQQREINTLIQNAFEMYEADGIGLMDYAAIYSGGKVIGISEDTKPYPTHRPLSIFKLVNVELLSNPEEILRPCLLPGYCFAFKGNHGRIKIRLAKSINIGSVTISHASKYLLDMNELTSAPKEFEVVGFINEADRNGVFLGKFLYDWMGNQHQTFKILSELSGNQSYQIVELSILSNYGRQEFTCIYRFRIHKVFN